MSDRTTTADSAIAAVGHGFTPLPLHSGSKKPIGAAWTRTNWTAASEAAGKPVNDLVREAFADDQNVGLLLGEPGGSLIDVDLDHPKTARLRDYFLPETPMRSGRDGRPGSHYWYIAEPGTLQGTKQHKMPDGAMCVEYRSTGGQSVIPPSIHPTGESYTWVGKPFGGKDGPSVVNGRTLSVQVALLALGTVLVDGWPPQGSRHEAYLALAGGLLRQGEGIHPYWERNAGVLIRAMAYATLDDDGPDAREKEVMGTTLKRLRAGEQTTGFTRLGELIGVDHVKQVRYLLGEVEAAAGITPRNAPTVAPSGVDLAQALSAHESELAAEREENPDAVVDPFTNRANSWAAMDLEPYLTGVLVPVEPTVLRRSDGQCLMYPGRINMLYGSSESAKSWLALQVCKQEMEHQARVTFIDLEDEPVNTLARMRLLGIKDEVTRKQFRYIHPEDPIATMERGRGGERQTQNGISASELFDFELEAWDPTLIVVDGLSVLYGLHGLDTDRVLDTDVIVRWLKNLTRNGRTTVIVIDHTGKTPEKGSLPIGSQHKVSMVMGTLLQVWMVRQPMPGRADGCVELVVLKDRPGSVRAVSVLPSGSSKAQVAAVVTVNSGDPTVTTITLDTPVAASTATRTPGEVKVDLERSAKAAAAETLNFWCDMVLNVFDGQIGRTMTMSEIIVRLPSKGVMHWGEETPVDKWGERAVKKCEDAGWLLRVNAKGEPAPGARKGASYRLEQADRGDD